MIVVETNKARLMWSPDGTVTKELLAPSATVPVLGSLRRSFVNEQRVNRMLARERPPIRVPALVGTGRRTIVMESIDGSTLGAKFPDELAPGDVDDLVALVRALEPYQPRRRWMRRFRPERRLLAHLAVGVIGRDDADAVRAAMTRHPLGLRFAHGDVTARNVIRAGDGRLVLIDWEWSGLYPRAYELAFLWFSLVDQPGGRVIVERAVRDDERPWFTLSALFVSLLHLQMWKSRPTPFVANHERATAELLAAVRTLT